MHVTLNYISNRVCVSGLLYEYWHQLWNRSLQACQFFTHVYSQIYADSHSLHDTSTTVIHCAISIWLIYLTPTEFLAYSLHWRLMYCTSCMIIIYLTYVNVLESMGKSCSCVQLYFLLQFTWESVHISTASHMIIRIGYYKSRLYVWTCNEIEGSYDKIVITIVQRYTKKKYHSFVAVGIVTSAQHK